MPDTPENLFNTEFRPPDEDMVEFILATSTLLSKISKYENMSEEDAQVISAASRSLLVLMAMAVSGFSLFSTETDHAQSLADLSQALYDRLVFTDPSLMSEIDISPITEWQDYRKALIDEAKLQGF
jgi:hypothetical protein